MSKFDCGSWEGMRPGSLTAVPAFDLSATRPARKSAATKLAVSASFSVSTAVAARVVSTGDLLFPVDFLRWRLVFDAALSPRANIFATTELALEFGATGRIACTDADRRIGSPDLAVESAAPHTQEAGGGHDEKRSRMRLVESAHRRIMLGVREEGLRRGARERGMKRSVPQVCVRHVCAA